ncbi:GNAT family N-acetyltransferase [Sulfidibacter corallicola]|uniref:GNAT family N-acetyltransferase n=1 Tax=Sulfidibacter corallicola TaxID=2818388 RepID=A0A8A4TGP9_SULCO|nr:GNAT family N-acetyltransferase [Sulfidibacter corallicola]QTD48384.1 GNAT family N-acetyltransferase [Sulfidibacter corallicola]
MSKEVHDAADWKFRNMKGADVEEVLVIIEDHDEDDAEVARQTYKTMGLRNKFVLEVDGDIVGTTGFNEVEASDRTYWLSWTYLDEDYRSRGWGRKMLDCLFERLQQRGARKIFLTTSDYRDPEDGDVYADARRFYESLGFEPELTHRDFYRPGEAMLYYARALEPVQERPACPEEHRMEATGHESADPEGLPPLPAEQDPSAEEGEETEYGVVPGARLTGISEIPETQDAYGLDWQYTEDGSMFTEKNLKKAINKAREWKARVVFCSFPSDIPAVGPRLEAAGFVTCGRLMDFYEDGVHDCHWRLNLD